MKKILFLIILFLFLFGLYTINKYNEIYKKVYKANKVISTPNPKKNEYVFALVGYGGEGHDGAYLTDSIMLVQINLDKKRATLISIPRDLWVNVPTKSGDPFSLKINAIYQLGFYPKTYPDAKINKNDELYLFKDAIKTTTGLSLDYYVSVDFNGFVKAVDSLGGIEVNVKKTFDDYVYPVTGKETDLCDYPEDKLSEIDDRLATEEPQVIFPCRYEHLHFDKGLQKMDGKTALKYVRSRHGLEDGGDFGRATRQQEFLIALKNALFSLESIPKIVKTIEDLTPYIQTDIPQGITSKFMKYGLTLGDFDLEKIVLSDDNVLENSYSEEGGYILLPKDNDWNIVKAFVKNTINRISPTPTPTPTLIQTPTLTKTQ